jgi:lysosomal Pro-X carboxypeptidase
MVKMSLQKCLGIVGLIVTTEAGLSKQRVPSNLADLNGGTPSTGNCTMKWQNVFADHFSWSNPNGYDTEFPLRYFTYDNYWGGPGSPIWFYSGNEGNVENYVNATGLMWENAEENKAMLVFAEHRFYGETWPCGGEDNAMNDCLNLLTHEQAMADYVQLLTIMKTNLSATSSPVITFGGSYGGMLSAWLRIKYPSVFAGAIAASAPILGFPGLPFYSQNDGEGGASYWDIVSYDTTEAAGSDPNCGSLLSEAFDLIATYSVDESGRTLLEEAFGLCTGELTEDDSDGVRLQNRVLLAYDDYAMGNYPFASNYISGSAPLPAYPMRSACYLVSDIDITNYSDNDLLYSTGQSINLLYNASQDNVCFNLDAKNDEGEDGIWDTQWCTQMMCQETYFTRRPLLDEDLSTGVIFPNYDYNLTWINEHCAETQGSSFIPRPSWITNSYYGGGFTTTSGMLPISTKGSNIIFTNGEYDPWRSAGVIMNDEDSDIISLFVAQGAHHLDLMFATPTDPDGLQEIRETQIAYAKKWASSS